MTEHRTFLVAANNHMLTIATCTCGWRSRPTKGMFAAQAKADHHRKVASDA